MEFRNSLTYLGHQVDKLIEADASISILVYFIDHFLKKTVGYENQLTKGY